MTAVATAPPLLAFRLEVAATVRLSPTFRRVTLAGDALAEFHGGGDLGTRDQRIKLVLPGNGSVAADLSDLSPGWYLRWRALHPRERGVLRTYTVRRARLTGSIPALDIDFVLHGDAGPGSAWAAAACPGDSVTILGPNAQSGDVAGVEWQPPAASPAQPVRVLLAGDETAVPAISAILESLPAGYRGQALLEVPGAEDFLSLAAPPGIEVIWLARGRRPYGQLLREALASGLTASPPRLTGAARLEPLAEVDIDSEVLWDTPAFLGLHRTATPEPFYAWVAGEAATVRDLRRLLVTEHGVDRASVAFMGYWRHGRAELL